MGIHTAAVLKKTFEGFALKHPQACQYFACGKAAYGVRTSFRYLLKRARPQTLFSAAHRAAAEGARDEIPCGVRHFCLRQKRALPALRQQDARGQSPKVFGNALKVLTGCGTKSRVSSAGRASPARGKQGVSRLAGKPPERICLYLRKQVWGLKLRRS